jgi:hypothetical protein
MSGNSSRHDQRDDPSPPHPSAHLPHDTLTGIHRWCDTIPMSSWMYGRIASVLVTNEATKFVGSHKSCMRQYIIKLAHRGQAIDP